MIQYCHNHQLLKPTDIKLMGIHDTDFIWIYLQESVVTEQGNFIVFEEIGSCSCNDELF